MRTIVTIVALTLATISVAGAALLSDTYYPATQAFTANYATLATAAPSVTNVTGSALRVDQNLYHTIHAYSASNLTSYCVDKSLDSTNWVSGVTNAYASTGEVTITGKEGFIRVRLFCTNSTAQVYYLGGR